MILSKEKVLVAMSNKVMTITQLHHASGVGKNTISRILNNHTKTRPTTAGKLAKALGVKVEDLI